MSPNRLLQKLIIFSVFLDKVKIWYVAFIGSNSYIAFEYLLDEKVNVNVRFKSMLIWSFAELSTIPFCELQALKDKIGVKK